MADGAAGAEQIDRLQHRVKIVGRLAHAHEHDLLHRPASAREHHLGHDLGAADLPDQTGAAGHAEDAADRTANLGGDTQTVPREQHALDGLAIPQPEEESLGAVFARMDRAQRHQRR